MKRAALFIGVNRYEDPEINNLDCAESDATELYAFFKHRAGYDDVRNLLSPDSDLLLDTAHDMAAGLAPNDLFLLFFAGHGVEYEGRHLLLCPRARYSRLKYHQHAVPLDLIKQETTRNGLHRVLILDACRTDLLRGERSTGAGLRDVKCLREMVSAEPAGAGSLAIICSCDEGQQSREIAQCRQGVFSLALLQTLQERLETGDAVTLTDQVEEILSQKMAALARNYGFTIDQRPWIQKSGVLPSLVVPSARPLKIPSEPIAETPPVALVLPVGDEKIPKAQSEEDLPRAETPPLTGTPPLEPPPPPTEENQVVIQTDTTTDEPRNIEENAAQAETDQCPYCQSPVAASYAFCTTCGRNLSERKCTACGCAVDKSWKFCPNCEKSLLPERKCLACGCAVDRSWKFCPNCEKTLS
ncbi:MAG: caspase family protein [Thermodesulfobacteriota bacterium]